MYYWHANFYRFNLDFSFELSLSLLKYKKQMKRAMGNIHTHEDVYVSEFHMYI